MKKLQLIVACLPIFALLTCFGCGEKPTHFISLMPGKVVKVSSRSAGNGVLYETTDANWIDEHIHALNAVSLTPEMHPEAVTGSSSMKFFGDDEKEIGVISFGAPGTIGINGNFYTMDREPDLNSLYSSFQTDEDAVKNN